MDMHVHRGRLAEISRCPGWTCMSICGGVLICAASARVQARLRCSAGAALPSLQQSIHEAMPSHAMPSQAKRSQTRLNAPERAVTRLNARKRRAGRGPLYRAPVYNISGRAETRLNARKHAETRLNASKRAATRVVAPRRV